MLLHPLKDFMLYCFVWKTLLTKITFIYLNTHVCIKIVSFPDLLLLCNSLDACMFFLISPFVKNHGPLDISGREEVVSLLMLKPLLQPGLACFFN